MTSGVPAAFAAGCALALLSGCSAAPPVRPAAGTSAVRTVPIKTLAEVFPDATVTDLPSSLGPRRQWQPTRLTTDGAVLGQEYAARDEDPRLEVGGVPMSGTVLYDPRRRTARLVHRVAPGLGSIPLAGDEHVVVGVDGTPTEAVQYADWRLWCYDRRQGTTTWLTRPAPGLTPPGFTPPVVVRAGTVWWSAVSRRGGERHLDTFGTAGCTGPARTIRDATDPQPVGGLVHLRRPAGGRSGATASVAVLYDPATARQRTLRTGPVTDSVANAAAYAWATSQQGRNTMTTVDWRTGARQVVFDGPVDRLSTPGLLQTGARVFAFRWSFDSGGNDGPCLYDPVTASLVRLATPQVASSEVFAAGRWVVWLAGVDSDTFDSAIGNSRFRLADLHHPAPLPPRLDEVYRNPVAQPTAAST